ncbi:hypothetical protein [Methanoregula sp.]|uniref:hypothetical protein n=1 Tax=Methanoregula sp. TaxID=2052170 RepID=UPI003C7368EA
MSDARITPSYDAGDPRKQDYEEFIVRKVERDGKTVFEPTGPSEGIDPRGKEIMTPDETQQPDLTKVSSRLSGLKTCDGRKCFVSKPVLSRRDKPGSRNETKGDGE